jgi:hypothetical protein
MVPAWLNEIGKFNWKEVASFGSGIGTVITIATKASSAVSQYTKEEKQKREISKATRLINFINRISENRDTCRDIDEVLPTLNEELALTLKCIKAGFEPLPHGDLSFMQRAFLLYSPVGAKAWFAHFVFYSLSAMAALGTLGMFVDEGRVTGEGALGLSIFAFVAWLFRSWALRLRAKRLHGVTLKSPAQRASPNKIRRLSNQAWGAATIYLLLVASVIAGYLSDSDSSPDAISFKLFVIMIVLLVLPTASFSGLAITARKAEVYDPEPKRPWNLKRFIGFKTPLTVGTAISSGMRYLFLLLFLAFLLNAGHTVRQDSTSLGQYWRDNLHQLWIFLVPLLVTILPFFAALRWSDLAALMADKRHDDAAAAAPVGSPPVTSVG